MNWIMDNWYLYCIECCNIFPEKNFKIIHKKGKFILKCPKCHSKELEELGYMNKLESRIAQIEIRNDLNKIDEWRTFEY